MICQCLLLADNKLTILARYVFCFFFTLKMLPRGFLESALSCKFGTSG